MVPVFGLKQNKKQSEYSMMPVNLTFKLQLEIDLSDHQPGSLLDAKGKLTIM